MKYDDIVAGGEALLQKFKADSEPETLELEFKSEASSGQGPWIIKDKFSDHTRKVLGKALSGLSNSAGGVLVLGVEARKGADGVDAVVDLVPFGNLKLVHSLTLQAVGDLLQPRHDGIRVNTIPTTADPAKGYIVLDVPRSERRPHRCEAKDQKQYFKRAGGSTFAMEHYDIEDAFKRISNAELELLLDWRVAQSNRDGHVQRITFEASLSLQNTGLVSAKYASVVLTGAKETGFSLGDLNSPDVQKTVISNSHIRVSAGANFVVHPTETRTFEKLRLTVQMINQKELYIQMPVRFIELSLPYVIYADNARPRQGILQISADELLEVFHEWQKRHLG